MTFGLEDPTNPGTEIKVTPDKEAPIIPNATKYQGACRPARKKFWLSLSLRLVHQDTPIRNRKYITMIPRINQGLKCVIKVFDQSFFSKALKAE